MESIEEVIRLSQNVMVHAGAKAFRLRHSSFWEFPPSAPQHIPEPGSVDVSRQTMAGAIYAGFQRSAAERILGEPPQEDSLFRYIYSIATMYHTTHSTTITMRRASARLAAMGHHRGADRCLHVVREEQGHDKLALHDLTALGLQAEKFVERFYPRGARDLASLYQGICDSEQPIGVFGYVYVLERLALLNTEETIGAVERLIPEGIKATRCMRVHSAVGSDTRHVEESLEFIASLDARDRAAIARAALGTSSIVHADNDDYPGDEVMCQALQEFGAGHLLPEDLSDDVFLARFEAGTLARHAFRHPQHVRTAFLYLCRYPALEALQRFATSLARFATATGGRYSETITWAFLLLIRERMVRGGHPQTWTEFAESNRDLLSWKVNVLQKYYRDETLFSDLARTTFLLPDKAITQP
jgi:hypothetical protein